MSRLKVAEVVKLWLARSPFCKLAQIRPMLICAVVFCFAAAELSISLQAADVQIVSDRPQSQNVQRAAAELLDALRACGHRVHHREALREDSQHAIVLGIAAQSPLVNKLVTAEELLVPTSAESLMIRRLRSRKNVLLIIGRDERGLLYAVREVARAVEAGDRRDDPFALIVETTESPFLNVRNVSMHLFNADLERRWYFDEAFWRDHLRRLSFSRFNRLTLTFSDQTNYLCPLYAYLVEMPEYPNVKVAGLTPEQRSQNLAMLRRIGELSAEYGIDLQLGIWMQAPVARWSAPVRVSGLPEGLEHAKYCALGLQRILEACPTIRGVQLRMNAEAGVNEEQQTDFYRPIFESLRKFGRPMHVDLRYKGLQPTTTQAAIAEQLDVTVSTKYWSEHFGLPYHPTSVDSHWREDRYSYGAMLRQPRSYRVTYQLWNVGSQRISLWGDPDYARRFVESCKLGGGDGFEVFAPLTNQGYGDKPGTWDVIRDSASRVGRWDQERYWFFYLCFGRLGFNPQANPELWRREFRSRFGESAGAAERAYRAASQVLPLITAARLPGASEWSWWPEMDTGGALSEYQLIQPSDPRQFYAIRSWKKSEHWRWESWDESPGFVDDLLAGKLRGKWTPWQIASRLDQLHDEVQQELNAFAQLESQSAEMKMTAVDCRWLSLLARYHSAKLRAATEWALYDAGCSKTHLQSAHKHLVTARDAWAKIVEVTEPTYHHDLVFGIAADSPRSKFGHHHTGHWRDRLPELNADVKKIEMELASVKLRAERVLTSVGDWKRRDAKVAHVPPTEISSREAWQVRIEVPANDSWQRVVLHHRPLDQTKEWREVDLIRESKGVWSAMVPAKQIDPQCDFQYYFELLDAHGGTIWPAWTERTPYFVVPVHARM